MIIGNVNVDNVHRFIVYRWLWLHEIYNLEEDYLQDIISIIYKTQSYSGLLKIRKIWFRTILKA